MNDPFSYQKPYRSPEESSDETKPSVPRSPLPPRDPDESVVLSEMKQVPLMNWVLLVVTFALMTANLGVGFALAGVFIMMSHELGHYIACRVHKIDATHPFFIPSPFLLGTFGAVIRIKEPFSRRRALFDVSIAGPIAGFIATVLVLLFDWIIIGRPRVEFPLGGVMYYELGTPIVMDAIHWLFFGTKLGSMQVLSGVGMAAWFGFLLTALNLIPGGQLDGGHIVHAMYERNSYNVGRATVVLLFILGMVVWPGWLMWSVFIVMMGIQHPPYGVKHTQLDGQAKYVPVSDRLPLDKRRKWLGVLALVIFLLSFSINPIRPKVYQGEGPLIETRAPLLEDETTSA